MSINKKDLIEIIAKEQDQLPYRDIELSVKTIIKSMVKSLRKGERIEIRGFGSFSLRYRKPRVGRNPKSGTKINIPAKKALKWKCSKILLKRLNKNFNKEEISVIH